MASTVIDITAFTCAEVGPNTVTLTVTDISGLTATCTATVTIEDNVIPDAICQDITIQLDPAGNATIIAADINNGSTDACGIATTSATPTTFTCAEIGPNTVTLTLTDANTNSTACTATVTVEDLEPPVALCQDITIQLDPTGAALITGADVDGGSIDNCSTTTLSVFPTSFNCANVGPNTVTLTVTDTNTNTATCTATVTVQEIIPPNALCQNSTIQLDPTGNATITCLLYTSPSPRD